MTQDFIEQANEVLDEHAEPPMSLDEYVDRILENPQYAAQSARYILNAIETAGERTVIEDGEEKERYCFFDDPYNDGEHAILGNTDILNQFVEDLRLMASEAGKDKKLIWFDGPTATGKSELKRCLINGLRAYSKTPDGARYTVEWNIDTRSAGAAGLTYGGGESADDESQWHPSPVRSHPLTVFPPEVRRDILAALNKQSDEYINITADLDPFSREAYTLLKKHYAKEGGDDLFSQITDPKHVRVSRHEVDVGQGIGILHSEDDGNPKQRLVGSWMKGMLQELNSRGRKNPQAFSYDGVLAQGNGGLTIVEDASQHIDLLQKLLNVPEEGMVKIDKKIGMDIDTVLLLISNPDLAAKLNQHAEKLNTDPLKALKRRLDKYEFSYLTSISSEVELLHRELLGETTVWADNEAEERLPEPVTIEETEFAPHALETAGLYSVVTRLDKNDVPKKINLVDKALIFERGYYENGDERIDKDEFAFDDDAADGDGGIPVTYTRDVLSDFIQDEEADVVLPQEVLEALVEGLGDAPVFSDKEVGAFESRAGDVGPYIHEQQEDDVIAAILRDRRVNEETVGEYIEHVYTWGTDGSEGDIDDPDPMKMKMFELNHLGRSEDDYAGTTPSDDVEEFRHDHIIQPLGHYLWKQRDDNYTVGDINLKEIPVIAEVLGSYDWSDVRRVHENLDPTQWRDPPSNTETEAVKETCLKNMQEMFGYSEEAARKTSDRVMAEVDYKWD